MKRKIIIQLLTVLFVSKAFAQAPDTDVFLISMNKDSGTFSFGVPENITDRKGYDNQPRFDSFVDLLYYVSQPDSTQTDIYLYNILTRKNYQLTHTPQSEYSPTPLRNKKNIACVRVDTDGSQHLYTYVNSGNFPVNLTPKNDSVGYYCWVDKSNYALFILGKKITLQLFNIDSNTFDTIAVNVGRCIQKAYGNGNISYTEKLTDSTWTIMQYNILSKEKSVICKSLTGSEDYAWTADRQILSGKDGKLYMFDTTKDEGWKLIADFSKSVGNFYRVAIHPKSKYLAVVAYKGKKP